MYAAWLILAACSGFGAGLVARRMRNRQNQVVDPSSEGAESSSNAPEGQHEWRTELRALLAARFEDATQVWDDTSVRLTTSDEVSVRVPLRLVEGPVRMNPERLPMALAHFAAEAERALQRTTESIRYAEVMTRLLPVVVPVDRTEREGEERRVSQSVADDLDIVFAIDGPSAGRWVTQSLADHWDRGMEELLEASISNLGRATEGATIVQESTVGQEVYRIAVGDGLDASRVLLQPVWSRIQEHCGEPLVLCMPTRDRMYAAPRSQPKSIERLSQHLVDDWSGRPHGVSPKFWIWNGGRLEAWRMNG